jgi:carboxypeptidase C (cathepsin A)
MFTSYIRNELGYKTDMFYYPSGGIQPWDYGVQNGFGDTTAMLRNAMVKNPYMKVMVAAAYYDLATPYYAVEHTFNHMGLSPEMHKQITWNFYQSGHMLYIDSDSHAKLKHDFSDFIQSCLPKGE